MYAVNRAKLKNLVMYNYTYLNEDNPLSLAGYVYGARYPSAGMSGTDPSEVPLRSKNEHVINRNRSSLLITPPKYGDEWRNRGMILTYNGFYKRKPCDLSVRLDDNGEYVIRG
jgi:hypothetical protein